MIVFAQYLLVFILSAFLIFHLLVLLSIIPYHTVWGGKLKTKKDMYRFEVVSILLNTFFLATILVHSKILPTSIPARETKYIIWGMFAVFALNTIGNFVSKNEFEKKWFTPITIVLTICCLLVALSA